MKYADRSLQTLVIAFFKKRRIVKPSLNKMSDKLNF